jgi:phosphoketolase
LADLAPKGDRRMGANPHANGGLLLHDLKMRDFHDHALQVLAPGAIQACDTQVLGKNDEFLACQGPRHAGDSQLEMEFAGGAW